MYIYWITRIKPRVEDDREMTQKSDNYRDALSYSYLRNKLSFLKSLLFGVILIQPTPISKLT